jgi:hypothetical protein
MGLIHRYLVAVPPKACLNKQRVPLLRTLIRSAFSCDSSWARLCQMSEFHLREECLGFVFRDGNRLMEGILHKEKLAVPFTVGENSGSREGGLHRRKLLEASDGFFPADGSVRLC